jgi:hypothetical protein
VPVHLERLAETALVRGAKAAGTQRGYAADWCAPCPVVALQTWLKLGRIAHGPLFRRIAGGVNEAGPDRLTDRHVARLVKRTALAAASGAICPKPSGGRSSPDIRCAPASPRGPNGQRRDDAALSAPA